jgi:hypothetical protein
VETAREQLVVSQQGPSLRLVATCWGCDFKRSVSYRVQGDSGTDVSCAHPAGNGYIGDTTWDTPKWCPFLKQATENYHQSFTTQS